MSQIIHPVRRTNVWGKDIEPEYRPRRDFLAAERGSSATIRIEGLRKSFGDIAVLEGIDLEIPAGQFVAVVGKSGCGKSTLLRLLSGLDELLSKIPLPAEQTSSMVLITGPSRTADIEQILVRGVHGPGEIHVVIL